MKIEVGQFVRVKGYIGKICNINEFREPSMEIGLDIPKANDIVFCGREDITKASYDIIDLIEVGDVIIDSVGKKYEVIQTYSPEGKYTLWIQLSNENFIDSTNVEDIKTILTKEQFEEWAFKVGE